MSEAFLPTVEGLPIRIVGYWIVRDGERGRELMAELVESLDQGKLAADLPQTRGGREWRASWRSNEGARLYLDVHPYSCTDAQSYDYVLELPDGTGIRFELTDACGTNQFDFVVRPGSLPFERIEAEIRRVFDHF